MKELRYYFRRNMNSTLMTFTLLFLMVLSIIMGVSRQAESMKEYGVSEGIHLTRGRTIQGLEKRIEALTKEAESLSPQDFLRESDYREYDTNLKKSLDDTIKRKELIYGMTDEEFREKFKERFTELTYLTSQGQLNEFLNYLLPLIIIIESSYYALNFFRKDRNVRIENEASIRGRLISISIIMALFILAGIILCMTSGVIVNGWNWGPQDVLVGNGEVMNFTLVILMKSLMILAYSIFCLAFTHLFHRITGREMMAVLAAPLLTVFFHLDTNPYSTLRTLYNPFSVASSIGRTEAYVPHEWVLIMAILLLYSALMLYWSFKDRKAVRETMVEQR